MRAFFTMVCIHMSPIFYPFQSQKWPYEYFCEQGGNCWNSVRRCETTGMTQRRLMNVCRPVYFLQWKKYYGCKSFVESWQSFRKSLVGSCSPKCRFTLSQCARLPALVSVGVSARCPKHASVLSWIVINVRSLTRNKLGTKNCCMPEKYLRRMIFCDDTNIHHILLLHILVGSGITYLYWYQISILNFKTEIWSVKWDSRKAQIHGVFIFEIKALSGVFVCV